MLSTFVEIFQWKVISVFRLKFSNIFTAQPILLFTKLKKMKTPCPIVGMAQLAFHELGHASQYRKVGSAWWANVGDGEIPSNGGRRDPTNPYGNGSYSTAGYVALTESWAEFLGMNYQLRRYSPNTAVSPVVNNAFNTCTRSRNYLDGTASINIFAGRIYPSQQLIENQMYFFAGGDWIPMGIYYDLMDNTNVPPNNPNEVLDRIQGVSIKKMYDAFGPTITTPCDYFFNFRSQNPTLNANDLNTLFNFHSVGCL